MAIKDPDAAPANTVAAYNYAHFSRSQSSGHSDQFKTTLRAGDQAPDFELPTPAHVSANARMARFELNSDEVGREIVLTVRLPVERPKSTGGQPKEHRFRPQDAALAARIQPFRALHDLTQGEVALAAGASGGPTVAQWELGINVPDGMRKRDLVALLDGHRWHILREAAIGLEGYPQHWEQAVRWYRRASREVLLRQALADPILSILKELRGLSATRELREHYLAQGRGWVPDPMWTLPPGATGRLVEDCAYGLRWIEVVQRVTIDVRRSLLPQLPDAVLSPLAPTPRRRRAARPTPRPPSRITD